MYRKILISVLILFMSVEYTYQSSLSEFNTHWDTFLLVQRWPESVCKFQKFRNPDAVCGYPKEENLWPILGLWAFRYGTSPPRPFRCNDSWPFEVEQIKSIESDLEDHWVNLIPNQPNHDFWGHHWDYHGTCSAHIPELNTQLKYFEKSLDLHKKYPLYEILLAANIKPDNKRHLTVEEISNGIKQYSGHQPLSKCIILAGDQYLRELHICLDKNFHVVECDGVTSIHGIKTECDISLPIFYPERESDGIL